MVKFKLCFDKDKETAWLNEMARQGYALTGYRAGFYTFAPCEPGEYIYQIDFTSGLFKVSDDYREFMEETGAEIVALWGFWVILRRKAADGGFLLYSDTESKIEHYRKIRLMFKAGAIIEIICFLMQTPGMMYGEAVSYAGAVVIALFIAVFVRMAFKTNQIVWDLREQAGESMMRKGRQANGLILSGMFMNLAAIGLADSMHDSVLRWGIQIAAIVLMLCGLWQMSRKCSDRDIE